MQVIEFLRNAASITDGLAELHTTLGIRSKIYEDEGLIVLNYDQIESPKTHPIVMECRGLIIDNDLNIACRPFQRFFNLGEALNVTPVIDWKNAVVREKVDGSLIKIYHYKDRWEIATRGTAFAESECMGFGVTFRELVYKALEVKDDTEFQYLMFRSNLYYDTTYLFELTCVENRVVKRYDGYTLHFLGAINNEGDNFGYDDYSGSEEEWLKDQHYRMGHVRTQTLGSRIRFINEWKFTDEEDCLKTSRELKDLDEGYVVYQNGAPVCKIKSPAYVAVHHIRGEGLNPKRISELVLSGEVDEYLTYFPEDDKVILPYVEAVLAIHMDLGFTWLDIMYIETQKEFALAIASHPLKSVFFNARSKGIDLIDSFNQQRLSWRVEMIKDYVK